MIVGEDETEVSASLRCKSASASLWMIAQFRNDLLDPAACLLAHVCLIVQHERDSRNRERGLLCDVPNGDSTFHHGIPRNDLVANQEENLVFLQIRRKLRSE